MSSLTERIEELESQIEYLQNFIENYMNDNNKSLFPYSKVGSVKPKATPGAVDIRSGFGGDYGGFLPWNDSELARPPYGIKPTAPSIGYNRHSHGQFSGGALDINTLELIEYDVTWATDENYDKDCQQFWVTDPSVKQSENTSGSLVSHVGTLKDSLVYDPDNQRWCVYAVYKDED